MLDNDGNHDLRRELERTNYLRRDLERAQRTGETVTVKTVYGQFRGKVAHVGFCSVLLDYGRSREIFAFKDIVNVQTQEPKLKIGETRSFEAFKPVKVLRCTKPLSFRDLKKLLCDHSDTATLTLPGEGGFTIKETFCLVCRKTVEMEIKRK